MIEHCNDGSGAQVIGGGNHCSDQLNAPLYGYNSDMAGSSKTTESVGAAHAFTIKTSSVTHSERKYPHSVPRPFTLPSDHVRWCQLIEGCPLPASRRRDPPSPPSSFGAGRSELPDLTFEEDTDAGVPSSPTSSLSEIQDQVERKDGPAVSNDNNPIQDHTPSIKTSHLVLEAHIGSGRLYHAFRATLTRVYHDDKLNPSTLRVVAKYVALDDFEEVVDRTANDGEHANNYSQDQVATAFANEVDLLLYFKQFSGTKDIVPQLHGLCGADDEEKSRFWLILEDCGEPADLNDLSIRRSTLNAYYFMHDHARVLHGDVQERHILLDSNGRVRIIDWEAGKKLALSHQVGIMAELAVAAEEKKVIRLMLGDLGETAYYSDSEDDS